LEKCRELHRHDHYESSSLISHISHDDNINQNDSELYNGLTIDGNTESIPNKQQITKYQS
jgi:hypothetical protein